MTDPDTVQTPFQFILINPFSDDIFFIDNNTGIITTAQQLDFEAIDLYSGFMLIIVDSEGLYTNASLEIQVVDDNDHSPQFPQTFLEFNVSELTSSGTEITMVTATDRDQRDNGFVMYFLNEDDVGGLFTIANPESGSITVNGALDFETQQFFELNITAQDSGPIPRQSFLLIAINILDENDNSPIIQNPNPIFNITENVAFGEFVGAIVANDIDAGTNAAIVYEITSGNDANRFIIDPENGTITTNGTIDREEQEVYTLVVEVSE